MRRALTICAIAACALAVAPASATTRSKYLWATINICNTPDDEGTKALGIRGSIAGDGQRTRMYMRFHVQYYKSATQEWVDVTGDPVTKWMYAGLGIYRSSQQGWTFGITPQPGATLTLRGVVDFKWTKRGHVVRTARVTTKGGHPNTVGADPKDYSAALCDITS
ncbi:MAG: hypothetical protein ACJ76Z_00960 [Thermoleophilaceae bacterium]